MPSMYLRNDYTLKTVPKNRELDLCHFYLQVDSVGALVLLYLVRPLHSYLQVSLSHHQLLSDLSDLLKLFQLHHHPLILEHSPQKSYLLRPLYCIHQLVFLSVLLCIYQTKKPHLFSDISYVSSFCCFISIFRFSNFLVCRRMLTLHTLAHLIFLNCFTYIDLRCMIIASYAVPIRKFYCGTVLFP